MEQPNDMSLATKVARALRGGERLRRAREILAAHVRGGQEPEKVALAIALGMVLGVFPVLGTTTALCALAAMSFRLNPFLIQVVNYSMYPVFLALLVPFFVAGAWLFGDDASQLSLIALRAAFSSGWLTGMRALGVLTWEAIAVWLLFAPVTVLCLRAVLLRVIRRARLPRKGPNPA